MILVTHFYYNISTYLKSLFFKTSVDSDFTFVSYAWLYTAPNDNCAVITDLDRRFINQQFIFLTAWAPIEGIQVFTVIKITIIHQMHMSPESTMVWLWR